LRSKLENWTGAKKAGKKIRDVEEGLQKSEGKERKLAQKIFWIVINKADILDQEFSVENDVESLDSKQALSVFEIRRTSTSCSTYKMRHDPNHK
jgi:GTPase involved in cell partitioning and DNA repair